MTTVAPWVWVCFFAFILALLGFDMLRHREAREMPVKEALRWVAFYVSLGVGFTFVIWGWQGGTAAGEYIAGYLIEYSLSVDNIFVFILLFSYFAVPPEHQHRVLFWGVLGALVFRGAFIAGGAALLHTFHFMTYVFGAFLVITAIRMAVSDELEVHPEKSLTLRVFRRVMPMTAGYRGEAFFVREDGRRKATQLLAVVAVVEATDIVFAVDSIPAIFAVTRNTFIVYSSNAFAILGLRALYFVLQGMMRRFEYLQIGLAVVLGFVGVKMLLSDVYEIPIWASLVFIIVTLSVAVLASIRKGSAPPEIPRSPEVSDSPPEIPGSAPPEIRE
jgi:tellurite resistance protein TerC